MTLWVLVYMEHYQQYREKYSVPETEVSLQQFLKEIGTPLLVSSKPTLVEESSYMSYIEVPKGTCIRLRGANQYALLVRERLFQEAHEKQDKSRRSSSCSIV